MSYDSVYERLCELVDKRINEEEEVKELLRLMEQNPDMRHEYEIQYKIKSLIATRCCKAKSPSHLCQTILSRIRKLPPDN